MATYTIDAGSNWGYISSDASTYANARAGSGTKTLYTALDGFTVGQGRISSSNFGVYQGLIEFDTAFLAGKTITSAVLKIYYDGLITTASSFTVEARLNDYGSSVTTADFVAGANLSSKTLLASIASGSITVGAQNSLTDVAMVANINTAGKTRIVLASDRTRTNSSPTTNNTYEYANAESPLGLVQVPVLEVTTAEANGELTKTIAAITVSSTVSIETFGVTSTSIGEIGVSAAGVLTSAGSGLVDKTIDAITLSAAIGIETFGYLDAVMDAITLNTAALVPREGVLSQSIGDITVASVMALDTTGVLSTSIGTIVLQTSTQTGQEGALSATLGPIVLTGAQSAPPWPFVHDFPQSPLDGTWQPELGDDTLRSEFETGARQYRTRNGGNYSAAAFAIMLKSRAQVIELDRFFASDCAQGTVPFTWEDPETGDIERWTWAASPAFQHVAGNNYRVECAVRKEAA